MPTNEPKQAAVTVWHNGYEFPSDISSFTLNDLEHFIQLYSRYMLDMDDMDKDTLALLARELFATTDSRDVIEQELKEAITNGVEDCVEVCIEDANWEKHACNAITKEKDFIKEVISELIAEKDQYCEQLDALSRRVRIMEQLSDINVGYDERS